MHPRPRLGTFLSFLQNLSLQGRNLFLISENSRNHESSFSHRRRLKIISCLAEEGIKGLHEEKKLHFETTLVIALSFTAAGCVDFNLKDLELQRTPIVFIFTLLTQNFDRKGFVSNERKILSFCYFFHEKLSSLDFLDDGLFERRFRCYQ